jgi:hypothetical protein
MTKKNHAFVALAFPSHNPVASRRRVESKRKAQRFGEPRNLGESRLVAKDTFGFVVEASGPQTFWGAASEVGARIIPFKEAGPGQHPDTISQNSGTTGKSGGYPGGETSHGRTDTQGIESGRKDPKAKDGGRPMSGAASSKVRAGDYGKTSAKTQARGLGEGVWIDVPQKVEAYRVEMSGTQPIGKPTVGKLHPGKYFVLGVQETRDGPVVTLGRTDKLSDIGSKEEGKYVFNVDGNVLEVALSEGGDRSKAGCPDTGGLLKKTIAKSARGGKQKKEAGGIIGAMAGAAQTAQRESLTERQVTADSAHARGIMISQRLRKFDESRHTPPESPEEGKNGETPSPKPAARSKESVALLEDVRGNTTEVSQDATALLDGAGGQLSGGPFDQPLDPGLEGRLAAYKHGMTTGLHVSGDQAANLHENQTAEVMGTQSVDPAEFAQRQKLAEMLAEENIDIETLSDEEIAELIQQMSKEAEEKGESDDGDDADDWKAEDLLPGDAVGGNLVGILSSRGYANAQDIAAKLEAGDPAENWFGIAGQSLQNCKRLQWAYVQAKKKGHF